jgi:hypothetical protein
VTDGPERDSLQEARDRGAARAVLRRRRGDLSRAVRGAFEHARRADRPHDCTIEVRRDGLLKVLPARRLAGWSLGTVQVAASGPANFALGSDGRLYWNGQPSGSRGIGTDGRFTTPGVFGPRRLSDDAEVLDGVMRLLEGGEQPPSEPV